MFFAVLYLAVLANLVGFVLFMLFLRQVALYFKDDPTSHEIVTIIVALIFLMLGGPLTIIFLTALCAAVLGRESALAVGGLGLIAMVVVYLNLLFRILTVISTLRARI